MKMALALWRADIQFILHDADLHLLRVKGEDWIGLYPDSYGLSGRNYFPTDVMCGAVWPPNAGRQEIRGNLNRIIPDYLIKNALDISLNYH